MTIPTLTLSLALVLTGAASAATKDVPIPEKVPSPPSSEVAPTVNIRTLDNGDVVEEYRLGGQLTMVRVRPLHGKPYYLYADNKGRLDRSDAERNGGVSPVFWVIYEWK